MDLQKCILFLVVLTVAVSALASENGSYTEAEDLFLQQSSDKNACEDLAKATEDEVRANVKAAQEILDGMDTGAKCKDTGQVGVKAATKQLSEKENAKKLATTALTKAQGATVNWGSVTFSSITEGDCSIFYNSKNYKNAKAKVEAAKKTKAKGDEAVNAFTKALEALENALVNDVQQCKCDVYKSHTKAVVSSTKEVEKANKKAWTKAANLRCVIEGTSSSDCKIPKMPTVKTAKLTGGVSKESCSSLPHKGNGENGIYQFASVGDSYWKLVRRVKAGNNWHPARDQMTGTETYGTYNSDRESDSTFSMKFDSMPCKSFLFATGDMKKWLITPKASVMGWYANGERTILKSSDNPHQYKARWYRRQGAKEDPWISIIDHHPAIGAGKIVYGENRFGHAHARNVLPSGNGANVFCEM